MIFHINAIRFLYFRAQSIVRGFSVPTEESPTMSAILSEILYASPPRRYGLWARLGVIREFSVAWRRRARARRELLGADDRMLADFGISRAQANFEAVSGRLD